MTTLKWGVASIALLLLLALIGVGIWQLGWFVEAKNVDRQAQVNQSSYQRQNALVEGILDDIKEAEGNIPPAQRAAIISQICDSASKLTGSITLSQHTITFLAQECPA